MVKVTAKEVAKLSSELIRKTGCSLTESHEALGNARCDVRKAYRLIKRNQRNS